LLQKETAEFITPRLWPPNLPDLNPVAYSMQELLQQKVYKILGTDLDETATLNEVGQAGS